MPCPMLIASLGAKRGKLASADSDQFHLLINLKTANATGLHAPAALPATANEVIE